MNLISRFVPKEFRPFLKHIGPSAFEVIDWKTAVKDLALVSKRFVTRDDFEDLKSSYVSYKPRVLEFGGTGKPIKESFSHKKDFGQTLLGIYFSQLKNPIGSILDLRLKNFYYLEEHYLWDPSPLWLCWKPPFREGLIQVYRGHYEDKNAELEHGLYEMGLIKDEMKADTKVKIKNLLLDHIGNDDKSAISFELTKFEESFEKFFQILKKEKIKLPSDFLFLGFYLVSLYSSLEKLGEKQDVKLAYENYLK